jgi:DNA gyrase subunit A
MLITEAGTLVRTSVDGINLLGRNTWGVKLINLGEEQKLAGIERIVALNGESDHDENGDNHENDDGADGDNGDGDGDAGADTDAAPDSPDAD